MTELSVYGVKVICDSKCKINDWHFQNAEERKVAEAINRLDLFLRCEMMTLKSIEVGEQRFHLPSEERKCPRCEYPYEPPKPPSSEDKKKECCEWQKYLKMTEDGSIAKLCQKHFDLLRSGLRPPAAPECVCHDDGQEYCPSHGHKWPTSFDAIKDNEKSLKPPQEAAKCLPSHGACGTCLNCLVCGLCKCPAQAANAVEEKIKEVARNWSVPPYEAIEKELFSLVDLARRTAKRKTSARLSAVSSSF